MADLNEFDIAAENAQKDLDEIVKTLDTKTVKALAGWWKKHFMKAGHKRLGRIIAKLAG